MKFSSISAAMALIFASSVAAKAKKTTISLKPVATNAAQTEHVFVTVEHTVTTTVAVAIEPTAATSVV